MLTADTDRYRRMLQGQLEGRRDATRDLDRSLSDIRAARSDGTADDEHDPEGSTLSSDWSRLEGLAIDARRHSAGIERALSRIADGGYGICLRCGGEIGRARLDARPAAEHCIGCARALEV